MANIIIIAILLIICVYAVYSYQKKLRHGGGCCGEHEAAAKKVRVKDKDKSHYPHTVLLSIDGMVCGNCTRHVENALNQLDGVWAQVDLEEKRATVRTKQEPDPEALKEKVRAAGYTVVKTETVS